jgi:hypothetical protein
MCDIRAQSRWAAGLRARVVVDDRAKQACSNAEQVRK